MNNATLSFETSAEMKAFIRRRKIYNITIDTVEVMLTAVMTAKDIEVACTDYHATLVRTF